MATKINPRWANRALRKKYQQRFRLQNAPCAICHGRLGEIDYTTSNPKAPLGFVIDEIIPISKYQLGGYDSPRQAAEDFNNVQPAHRICNQMKGNKINYVYGGSKPQALVNVLDGEW